MILTNEQNKYIFYGAKCYKNPLTIDIDTINSIGSIDGRDIAPNLGIIYGAAKSSNNNTVYFVYTITTGSSIFMDRYRTAFFMTEEDLMSYVNRYKEELEKLKKTIKFLQEQDSEFNLIDVLNIDEESYNRNEISLSDIEVDYIEPGFVIKYVPNAKEEFEIKEVDEIMYENDII